LHGDSDGGEDYRFPAQICGRRTHAKGRKQAQASDAAAAADDLVLQVSMLTIGPW
jgi:hypothetical protein